MSLEVIFIYLVKTISGHPRHRVYGGRREAGELKCVCVANTGHTCELMMDDVLVAPTL